MENWELILSSKDSARAEIAKGMLQEQQIHAVIMDKKDSNYPVFGFFEVYVPLEDAERAKTILTNEITPE